MRSALSSFLAEQRGQPAIWGENDCTLFCASWVEYLTGHDPGVPWRGSYTSKEGATCIVAGSGGLPALFDSGLETFEFVSGPPQMGDIGVVVPRPMPIVPSHLAMPRGAICTGSMWALKTPEGLALIRRAAVLYVKLWRMKL